MRSSRPAGSVASTPHRSIVGRWLAIGGAVLIALATLTPAQGEPGLSQRFCIFCGSVGGVDAFLNVLLFAPLGAGLALAGVPVSRALAAVFAYSLSIECLQFSVISGRDASIGDLLMNAIGGAAGFAIGSRIDDGLAPSNHVATKLVAAWTVLWLAVQSIIAYSLIPALPQAPYFGQLARAFGPDEPVFEGDVFSATVEAERIPDTELPSATRVRELLSRRQGGTVRAAVAPRGVSPAAGVAPIVRVAFGDADREILIFAQSGTDFLFGIRTGAEVMKLRPVRFRLRDVFQSRAAMHGAPDTILLEGRYARSSVSIRARSKDSTREQSTAHGLSHGWRLVAPVQTYAAGGALSILASGLWLAGLILPLGYWSVFAVRGADRRYRPMSAAVTALCATVVVAALVMVSQALGLSALPAWEWAAAAFGAIAGAALGIWRKSVGSRRRTRAPARGEP